MVPPALTRPRRVAGSELVGRLLGTARLGRVKQRTRVSEVDDSRFLQTLDPIFWTGTRTQKIAQTYMALKINSVSLEYVPSASSLVTGTVYLAFFRANDLDWTSAGLTSALSSGSARVNQQFMVHMDPSYLQNRRQEFDVRDVLSFPVAVAYVEGASTDEVFGHLRLHYNYSFSSPTSEELVYQSARTTLQDVLQATQDGVAPIAAFVQEQVAEDQVHALVAMSRYAGTSPLNQTQFSQKVQLGKVLTFKIQPTGLVEVSCDGYSTLMDPEHAETDLDLTVFSEGQSDVTVQPVTDRPLSFKIQIQRASLRYDIIRGDTSSYEALPGLSLIKLSSSGTMEHAYYSGSLISPPMNTFFDEDVALSVDGGSYTTQKLTATVLHSATSIPFSFNTADEHTWHYVEPGNYCDPPTTNRWVLCLYWLQSQSTFYQGQDENSHKTINVYTLYRPVLQVVQCVGDYFYGTSDLSEQHIRSATRYAMWPFQLPSASGFTQDTVTKSVNSYGFFYAYLDNPFGIMPIAGDNIPYQNQPGGFTMTMPIRNSRVHLQPVSLHGISLAGGCGDINSAIDTKGYRINSSNASSSANNAAFSIMNSFINQSLILNLAPIYQDADAFHEFTTLPIFDGINKFAPDFWSRYSLLPPPTARSIPQVPDPTKIAPPPRPKLDDKDEENPEQAVPEDLMPVFQLA